MLKGVTYKQGLIPAMLVDTAMKNKEWDTDKDIKNSNTDTKKEPKNSKIDAKISNSSDTKTDGKKTQDTIETVTAVKKSVSENNDSKPTSVSPTEETKNSPIVKSAPAIKKGFLNNAKSTVYPESVSAKIKKPTGGDNNILLPGSDKNNGSGNFDERTAVSTDSGSGSLVQELTESQLKQLKKTGTLKSPGASGGKCPSTSIEHDTLPLYLHHDQSHSSHHCAFQ